LRLPEALDMGLAVETFDRKKALPNKLELTELEREYFSGEARTVWGKHGQKTHWVNCRRVELNALSADPHRFIAWVEATLQEHGVARKLVPPKKVIHSAARDQRDTMLKSAIRDAFHRHLDLDSLVATTAKTLGKQVDIRTLPEKLREWATKLEPISWRKHLESLVQGRVAQLADPITDMVTETLAGIATETPKCDDGGQPT